MTGREPSPPPRPCQIEIPVPNLVKAAQFYEHILGWQTSPVELHEAIVFDVGDDAPVGVCLRHSENSRSGHGPIPYFKVSDIDDVIARVESKGGTTISHPAKMVPYGYVAKFADPAGNVIGLFQERISS